MIACVWCSDRVMSSVYEVEKTVDVVVEDTGRKLSSR